MNGDRLLDRLADAAMPMATPAIIATPICFSATTTIDARLAPSAVLTASSRDRCDTDCDSTPNNPVAAMTSANAANPRNNTAYSRGRDNARPTR